MSVSEGVQGRAQTNEATYRNAKGIERDPEAFHIKVPSRHERNVVQQGQSGHELTVKEKGAERGPSTVKVVGLHIDSHQDIQPEKGKEDHVHRIHSYICLFRQEQHLNVRAKEQDKGTKDQQPLPDAALQKNGQLPPPEASRLHIALPEASRRSIRVVATQRLVVLLLLLRKTGECGCRTAGRHHRRRNIRAVVGRSMTDELAKERERPGACRRGLAALADGVGAQRGLLWLCHGRLFEDDLCSEKKRPLASHPEILLPRHRAENMGTGYGN